jgi:hypothetical protein
VSLGIQGSFTKSQAIAKLSDTLENAERAAFTLTNVTKEGRVFKNYLRIAPLMDAEHRSVAFMGVLMDYTQRHDRATV